MSDEERANGNGSENGEAPPVSAVALKLLRDFSGLTQGELGDRSDVGGRTVGKYERGEQELKVDDLHRMLEAMDLPERAWTDMLRTVDRLAWLRTRHIGSRGEVAEGGTDRGPARILDGSGRFDWTGARREIGFLAEDVGHSRERELSEILELLMAILRSRGAGD